MFPIKKIANFLIAISSFSNAAVAQKTGIGTNTPSNMLEVISAVNPIVGLATIYGLNNGNVGTAITGNSPNANTRGIMGSSQNGFGVQGYTNNNIGVSAFSLNGNALSSSSLTGYALQTSGNIKFAGGNTNPSDGAVLTSDATGNAVWKKNNVAFLAVSALPSPFDNGVFKKVEFLEISYDLQGNFKDYNGGTTPATSSMFTAPVAGVYHFSSNISFFKNAPTYYFSYADIRLVKNTSSNAMATFRGQPLISGFNNSEVNLQLAGTFHLDAGDKIWIEALQSNGSTAEKLLGNWPPAARFSGHLVVAD